MRPPRLWQALLRWSLPPGGASGDSLLGDLFEEYAEMRDRRGRLIADGWYVAQVIVVALPFLGLRARDFAARWTGAGLLGARAELRQTLRALARNPGTVAVAALSLTLGIGLSTSAYGIIHGLWFAPLPYPQPERLVDLEDTHPVEVCLGCSPGTSYRSYLEWKESLDLLQDVQATVDRRANLTVVDRPRPVRLAAVSGGLARLMGLEAALGRTILPEDDDPGAPRVLVLGHGLWRSAFGGDPGVLGRDVTLDGKRHTVVGVLPEDARPLDRSQAWVALAPEASAISYEERGVWVVGRLGDGVDVAAVHEELAAFASARYRADPSLDGAWSARARPLRSVLSESAPPASAAAALLLATLLVLLIASVNLAAVLLARTTERERELGIRIAVGASRRRLVRYAGMEALVLSVVGGVGGVSMAIVLGRLGRTNLEGVFPGWVRLGVDGSVLAMATALTLFTALVCGLLPMMKALDVRPGGLLQRLVPRGGRDRLRRHDWLLGAQIALGVVLVAGTGSAVRTFLAVSDFTGLGFRTEGIATLSFEGGGDRDQTSLWPQAEAVRQLVDTHPAANGAAVVAPLFLGSWGGEDAGSPVWVEGAEAPVSNTTVPRHSAAVGSGYLELLEIPILAGRSLQDADGPAAPPVAVVSKRAGEVLWPGVTMEELPGRRFRLAQGPEEGVWFTVVGVSGDVVGSYRSPSRQVSPQIYTSLAHTPVGLLRATPGALFSVHFEVRGPLPSAQAWESRFSALGDAVALGGVSTPQEIIRSSISPIRVTAQLLSGLSAVAVGLLALGVYGTLSYRVARQRYDIGVRLALGAEAPALAQALTRRITRVFVTAALVGGGAAVVIGNALASGPIPVGGTPATVAGVLVLVGMICALSCAVPVARALRVDPMDALRTE